MSRLPQFSTSNLRLHYILILLFVLTSSCTLFQGESEIIPPLVTDPPPPEAIELAAHLLTIEVPQRNLGELAQRLGGVDDIAPDEAIIAPDYEVGDKASFWYKNHVVDENILISATLIYRSDVLNLWLEIGQTVKEADIAAAAEIIESTILPTNRDFFGFEAIPGIDGDERLNILYLEEIGPGIGGYFSAADQFSAAVNRFSNQREILYINLATIPFDGDEHFTVVAHELQHLIHQNTDKNEALWLDEGLSELAAYLNDYPTPDRSAAYSGMSDLQLTNLSQQPDVVGPHYSAAFLFSLYFYRQFGEEATKLLVQNEANGLAGVDQVLLDLGFPLTAEQVFVNWAVANYMEGAGLIEPEISGPYWYKSFDLDIPAMELAADHGRLPAEGEGGVNQFGVDYIRIEGDEPVTLRFTGSEQVPLSPTSAHSGDYFWSTFPADRSDMRLTGRFDLTSLTNATLTFWHWYDIEEDWDYAYIAASVDNGTTWTLLEADGMTRTNPQGNSYGPAFTGLSGNGEQAEWEQVTLDISQFAGQDLMLRFEYVTDDAVHHPGWAIDDIAIPELDLLDDAESAEGDGWEAAGFVRHNNILPQRFVLQGILVDNNPLDDDFFRIIPFPLDDGQSGEWTVPLDDQFSELILVVTSVTPVTTERAAYTYYVEEAPE